MDASLDTNVIIHLYNANLQDILFNRFEKLKVYDFILEDSEVMPFAFYELLFLDFLEKSLTEAEVLARFRKICDSSGLTMNCSSKLKAFMRRFWSSPYSESEREWMEDFCVDNGINAKSRIQQLHYFLTK